MGLDMYLHRQIYVGNYSRLGDRKIEFREDGLTENEAAEQILSAVGIDRADTEEFGGITVNVPVMYWRKENAIHDWFVRNVQGGEDDCGDYLVDTDTLSKLVDTIDVILMSLGEQGFDVEELLERNLAGTNQWGGMQANDLPSSIDWSEAESLLPTASGFFFGSTEYNYWYLNGLVETSKRLKAILDTDDKYPTFVYSSSW